jgi:hypothetical protein
VGSRDGLEAVVKRKIPSTGMKLHMTQFKIVEK